MKIPQWIVILVILAFVSTYWSIDRRIRRLEAVLDRLSRHVGALPPLATEPSQKVRELAGTPGKKIEAIRALREEMGLDLKEAKRIIDSLESQER